MGELLIFELSKDSEVHLVIKIPHYIYNPWIADGHGLLSLNVFTSIVSLTITV